MSMGCLCYGGGAWSRCDECHRWVQYRLLWRWRWMGKLLAWYLRKRADGILHDAERLPKLRAWSRLGWWRHFLAGGRVGTYCTSAKCKTCALWRKMERSIGDQA